MAKNSKNSKNSKPETIGIITEAGQWTPVFWMKEAAEFENALHIRFVGKPTGQARDLMKAAGFRYQSKDQYWYCRIADTDIVKALRDYLRDNCKLIWVKSEAEYRQAAAEYADWDKERTLSKMRIIATCPDGYKAMDGEKKKAAASKETEPKTPPKKSLSDILNELE